MMRAKRPAAAVKPDGGRPSPSSSPLPGGDVPAPTIAEETTDANPPTANTPDGSSADGDPNTSNPPSKIPSSISSPRAEPPSPSPSKRPKNSPTLTPPNPPPPAPLAATAAASAAASAATSRRSDRKRKPRELLAGGGGGHQKHGVKKVWDHPDEVALLKAAIAFRSQTGDLPRRLTMARFFDSIKCSISPFITLEQVGYKLKRLKGKYARWVTAGSPSAGATSHDRLINELSAQIWGPDAKQSDKDGDEDGEDMEADTGNRGDDDAAEDEEEEAEEEEGVACVHDYPFIREAAENHWKGLGNYNAFVSRGLKFIDLSKAKVLEEKLRKQCEAEALLLTKRLDLYKELSQLLMEANKSSRF